MKGDRRVHAIERRAEHVAFTGIIDTMPKGVGGEGTKEKLEDDGMCWRES